MAQFLSFLEQTRHLMLFFTLILAFGWAACVRSGSGTRRYRAESTLPVVNRWRKWEPDFFARFRWIVSAQDILVKADKPLKPYYLCRGDADQIILPPSMIPELNKLGLDVLNSRDFHAIALLGNLTGMDVVRKTGFHVRVLLSYITPAVAGLFGLAGERVAKRVEKEFPKSREWTTFKPNQAIIGPVSELIALILFGAEMTADNEALVNLTHEHTSNVFGVTFLMRCVPAPLQPLLVWLVPAKWQLIKTWRALRSVIFPRVEELKAQNIGKKGHSDTSSVNPDVLSWMVADGRNDTERDPGVLTTLVGMIAAGSTHSVANFCCGAISDMVEHPEVLEAVRAEILEKHEEIGGRWDMASVTSLVKLDSAMKETSRLTPGTLIIYARIVQKDCLLSNGILLKRGQSIALSSSARTRDPEFYEDPDEYKGLRFCTEDKIAEHQKRPFSSVDPDILTWGAGRWSCPGRVIGDIAAKILLVKALSGYDFAFVDKDKPLGRGKTHEFIYFNPENEMLVRRREDAPEIVFC